MDTDNPHDVPPNPIVKSAKVVGTLLVGAVLGVAVGQQDLELAKPAKDSGGVAFADVVNKDTDTVYMVRLGDVTVAPGEEVVTGANLRAGLTFSKINLPKTGEFLASNIACIPKGEFTWCEARVRNISDKPQYLLVTAPLEE